MTQLQRHELLLQPSACCCCCCLLLLLLLLTFLFFSFSFFSCSFFPFFVFFFFFFLFQCTTEVRKSASLATQHRPQQQVGRILSAGNKQSSLLTAILAHPLGTTLLLRQSGPLVSCHAPFVVVSALPTKINQTSPTDNQNKTIIIIIRN